MDEIERKFTIKQMPDLSGQTPIKYERYFLKRGNGIEDRVQIKGEKYQREVLEETSELGRKKMVTDISLEEFDKLKAQAAEAIIRDGYIIDGLPGGTIKIYHGRFEGLTRAEVEFPSEEEAKAFQPLEWFGPEISDTPLARDSRLLDLSDEEFKAQLNKYIQ